MNRRALALSAAVILGGLGLGGWLLSRSPAAPPRSAAPSTWLTPTSGPAPAASTETLAVLLARLRAEGDAAARRAIVKGLAPRADAAALLEAVFEQSQDGAVREEALMTAAQVGSPEATSWLARVAGSDEALAGRAGAALGAVASPRAAADLALLVWGTGPVIVRANAARALAASGTPTEARALAKLAANVEQPLRVRQEAALALAKIGTEAQASELAAALDAAADKAGSEPEQLRISLIQALGGIQAGVAREALSRHLARKLSALERAFVEQALVQPDPG